MTFCAKEVTPARQIIRLKRNNLILHRSNILANILAQLTGILNILIKFGVLTGEVKLILGATDPKMFSDNADVDN